MTLVASGAIRPHVSMTKAWKIHPALLQVWGPLTGARAPGQPRILIKKIPGNNFNNCHCFAFATQTGLWGAKNEYPFKGSLRRLGLSSILGIVAMDVSFMENDTQN